MKQQDIIEAVVERLKIIDGNNPYETDLDSRVEDSRTNWDENELPAVSIFEQPAETESPDSHRKVIHVLPIQIKAFLKRGETAENARQVIADIKRAIQGEGGSPKNGYLPERFPNDDGEGLAMETRPKRHGIEYEPNSWEVVGAIVEIELIFITPKWEI